MSNTPSLSSNSKILNGTPVIAGTRIPVSRILYLLSQGYAIEDIRKEYPQLAIKTIKHVIAAIAKQAEAGAFLNL